MSEPIKLNSGGVATLADTDRVVGCDSTGALRSISLADLLKQIRDSIHIGGRNLLKGSMKSMGNQSNYIFEDGVHSIIMTQGGMGIYKSAGTHPIDTYCISVELKGDVPMDVRWYLANNEMSAKTFNVTTEWKRYTAILKPTSGSLQFRLTSQNLTNRFYARFPKIEQGNIPTGFSIAPEDLSGVIRNHSIGYGLRKGGVPHESANHTDRRSYTLLTQDGTVRGIACRDNDERSDLSGRAGSNRRFYLSRCVQDYESYNWHSPRSLFVRDIDSCRLDKSRSTYLHPSIRRRRERRQPELAYTDCLGRQGKKLAQTAKSIRRVAGKEVAYV